MWKHPRLSSLVVAAVLACSLVAGADVEGSDNKKEATRWRWPDETNPLRSGAGRLTPSRLHFARVIQENRKVPRLPNAGFLTNPNPVPGPAPGLVSSKRPEEVTTPKARRPAPVTATPVPEVPESDKSAPESSDSEPSAAKNNSVPLLKDAGKPGNPYILLNDIFPPENFIRTKEEEAANLNALKDKDIGNLDPKEVWLADDDLFVVRGFNFKKPYSADPSGPPISDYEAPSPNPPPPPEPGTVFYPTNDADDHNPFNFFHPDFNSTDPSSLPFFPFVPGGLNDTGRPPIDFQNLPPPFPFLPPPPPHWTEEKEFNNNELLGPGGPGAGNFPFSQGPGQGLPPPSGLNGFPNFPQFPQNGQFGQQPPPGFPPAGVPPFGQGGFPPGPQGFPPNSPPNGQGFPPNGPPNGQGFPPNRPPSGQGFPPNAATPPSGAPEAPGAPEGNVTIVVDEDDGVPFTPLFPERPVEFYYPTHNTTAQPPGPFGPGIFVPPPVTFFAPRNESEAINVKIPEKLFRPPFNLPNYYQKQSAWRPIIPPRPSSEVIGNVKRPETAPVPLRNPALPSPIAQHIPSVGGLANPALIKVVPGPKPLLLDHQFKEIEKLPQLSAPQTSTQAPQQEKKPPKQAQTHKPSHQTYPAFSSAFGFIKNQYKHPAANYGSQHSSPGVISLESDIDVNHKLPRPSVDPDSEIIDPSLFQPNPTWSPYSVQNRPASPYAQFQFGQLRQPAIGHRTTSATHSLPAASSVSEGGKTPINYVRVYGAGGSYSYPVGKR